MGFSTPKGLDELMNLRNHHSRILLNQINQEIHEHCRSCDKAALTLLSPQGKKCAFRVQSIHKKGGTF